MSLVTVPPYIPKGIYEIRSLARPNLNLVQLGSMARRDGFNDEEKWIILPATQGGNRYEIKNLSTSDPLRVGTCLTPETNTLWSIDTQFDGFVIGLADDLNERVVTSATDEHRAVLWPISGRKAQRWSLYSSIPDWIKAHNTIDISKLYYIKNCASGRFWSYLGSAHSGHITCDRVLQPGAAYFRWKLMINSQDQGMLIATTHGVSPVATQSMTAASEGNSFYFMPVPGHKDRYFIASGLNSNPPNVVTGRQTEDSSKPASISPLVIDNNQQMFQLIDATT